MADPGRVLALDFGAKRTGVALSDPTRTVVTPQEPVSRANSPAGLAQLVELVSTNEVVVVVVGLPVGMQGATLQTERTRSFAARLARELDVPVELHDERFTSKMADRTTAQTGSTASRDSLAASHLLEDWLRTQG